MHIFVSRSSPTTVIQSLMKYRSVEEKAAIPSKIPVTFLLNYTNPILESVSDAFAISQAHADPPTEHHAQFYESANYMYDGYMADLFSDIFSDVYTTQVVSASEHLQVAIPAGQVSATQHRVDALISLLVAQYSKSPTVFPYSSLQAFIDAARVVFTSSNIVEYVFAFFSSFHPHTPFLHRPSFDIEKVSLHLLLAVLLVGSVFAAPQDDALSARHFFGIGEDHVFDLLREVNTHDLYSSKESIEIVQAAVVMHALQVNSNQEGVRHRIRVRRFPEIVAAMRRLGLFGIVRRPPSGLGEWETYVEDEIKIRFVNCSRHGHAQY
jgi:hypothetical protein